MSAPDGQRYVSRFDLGPFGDGFPRIREVEPIAWDLNFAGTVIVLNGCGHWLQADPLDGPGDRERWCPICDTLRPVAAEIVAWETAADWNLLSGYARERLAAVQGESDDTDGHQPVS